MELTLCPVGHTFQLGDRVDDGLWRFRGRRSEAEVVGIDGPEVMIRLPGGLKHTRRACQLTRIN